MKVRWIRFLYKTTIYDKINYIMKLYKDSPRIKSTSSKLLFEIINDVSCVESIECDFQCVSYNEVNRQLLHWKDILDSYIFDIDDIKYIVDFKKTYLGFDDIILKYDMGIGHLIHKNQYYRNKPIKLNNISLNLLERFYRPTESKNKRFGLYCYDDEAMELYNSSKNNEILGKLKYIIGKHILGHPEIFVYKFNDSINFKKNELLIPDKFISFEMNSGTTYNIRKTIINDRYCF